VLFSIKMFLFAPRTVSIPEEDASNSSIHDEMISPPNTSEVESDSGKKADTDGSPLTKSGSLSDSHGSRNSSFLQVTTVSKGEVHNYYGWKAVLVYLGMQSVISSLIFVYPSAIQLTITDCCCFTVATQWCSTPACWCGLIQYGRTTDCGPARNLWQTDDAYQWVILHGLLCLKRVHNESNVFVSIEHLRIVS